MCACVFGSACLHVQVPGPVALGDLGLAVLSDGISNTTLTQLLLASNLSSQAVAPGWELGYPLVLFIDWNATTLADANFGELPTVRLFPYEGVKVVDPTSSALSPAPDAGMFDAAAAAAAAPVRGALLQHQYNASGQYTVAVKVVDVYGQELTGALTVQVRAGGDDMAPRWAHGTCLPATWSMTWSMALLGTRGQAVEAPASQ